MLSSHRNYPARLRHYSRADWLYLITVSGLLIGISLTLPLWSAERHYPLSPVVSDFALPPFAHLSLTALLVFCLVAGLYLKSYRWALAGSALGCLILLTALDITRFHSWVFHYSALLVLFISLVTSTHASEKLLDAARIIIGGIYFWSGIQKLNITFWSDTFPWFTQPLWEPAPTLLLPLVMGFGLLVPFLEITLAIGLFVPRLRRLAIIGSGLMMLLVIVCLGPLGHHWNSVVWPWNIALFLMVITLFWRTTFSISEFIGRQGRNLLGLTAFILIWLLPLGNAFGLVDHYLAWSLYSGRAPEAVLSGDSQLLQSLSPASRGERLELKHWSLTELNQAPYPEARVFEDIFQTVCTRLNNPPSLDLTITAPRSYLDSRTFTQVTNCQSYHNSTPTAL